MADVLDHLESMFSGEYNVQRVEIRNARRLTLEHMGQAVTIDLFTTGKVNVAGTDCPLRDQINKHAEGFRKDPNYFKKPVATAAKGPTPEEAILNKIKKELFELLPEHDRQALIAAYQVMLSGLDFVDYSPAIMPVGQVYEGFWAKSLSGRECVPGRFYKNLATA